MNAHGVVLLAACLLVAGDNAEELRRKELAALQGVWRTVSVEIDGEALKEADFKDHRMILRRDTFVLEAKSQTNGGTFTVDPAKRPKTIDTETLIGVGKGTKALGIYVLDGDTLRVCYAAEPNPRPAEFRTRPKSKRSLVVYKRIER